MNLLRVGNRVLNLDNVALVGLGRADPEPGDLLRVYFDSCNAEGQLSHVDFTGREADQLRRYLDHYSDDVEDVTEAFKANE